MLVIDIETLGTESNSVILCAAIVHFDPVEQPDFKTLKDRTLFVKFDAKEQIALGRKVEKSTLEWWNKQSDYVRSVSFDKTENDVSAKEGLQIIKDYISKTPLKKNQTMWARGSMDQCCLDSLAKAVDIDPLVRYNKWRDIRTAIDLLYGSSDGYTDIEHDSFNNDEIIAHLPYFDVLRDAMMIMYGKQKGE